MNSGTRKILRQYAREKQVPIRDTKDISPLSKWLIFKLNEYRQIEDCQKTEQRKIEILNSIKKAVCEVKGISEEEFDFKSGKRIYAEPRQLFCSIAKSKGISIRNIAKSINRHHSTVLYSIIQANNKIDTEVISYENYLAVMKKLKNT